MHTTTTKTIHFILFINNAFVNENEFVTTNLHLLSANVPILQEVSFVHNPDGLQYLANQISRIIRN